MNEALRILAVLTSWGVLAFAQEIPPAPLKSPTEENTPKLGSVKPYEISINKSNQALSLSDGSSPSISSLYPGFSRKPFKIGAHSLLLSYGQGLDQRLNVVVSNQNDPSIIHSFKFLGQSIQLGPRGAVTIACSSDFRSLEFTSGHVGRVTLNDQLLTPGNSRTALAGVPTKTTTKTIKRASPTPVSPEKQKAQAEAMRKAQTPEVANSVPPRDPLPSNVTNPPITDQEPSASSTLLDPMVLKQEIEATQRQNQALLQVSQALKQLIDSLTNNAQDTTLRLQIPPPPPLRPLPEPKGSSEAQALALQKRLQELSNENQALAQSIKDFKKQLSPLQENRANVDYSLRPEIPEEVRTETKRANQAFAAQNYDEATEIYRKILQKFPKALHPLSNLGVTLFTQGKYKEAEQVLRDTITIAPHDAFSYSILGIVLYQLQRPDEAWYSLSLAAALQPDDPQTHNYLSLVLARKGLTAAAEREAREAITLNPNYADAHYHLSLLYANPEKPSKELARRHYLKSVDLGGARDERLESALGVVPPPSPAAPVIETNPH